MGWLYVGLGTRPRATCRARCRFASKPWKKAFACARLRAALLVLPPMIGVLADGPHAVTVTSPEPHAERSRSRMLVVLQTGLTRDGAFLIEDGRVTRPLKNFRWNESPLLMLNRLEDIGRPEPTAAGRLMPALRVRDFNFSSLSDAV